ncbi:MAG: hypothetical protein EXR11_11455 [Rhodospirillaceae bacterium]|nr:hypothetical protein [Rhodospirillaceae bacterium]
MIAQRDTDVRRRLQEVQADRQRLEIRQEEFESFLQLAPATTLLETAAKAKYLIQIFAGTAEAQHPRRQDLIKSSLKELDKFFDGPLPTSQQ